MERSANPLSGRAPCHRGVRLIDGGAEVSIYSRHADALWFCLFDESGTREISRWRLKGRADDMHFGFVPAIRPGARYGLRADGPWQPGQGHRFDPKKLLVDPHAVRIDRPFRHAPELCLPRDRAVDTAPFVPRAIIEASDGPEGSSGKVSSQTFGDPRFIYEIAVKAFTKLHPDVPLEQRGTLAGLAHPRVIDHLVRLGVSHVELMPVAAWTDERHLPSLGLSNAWGYNPVCFMALDPRLAPDGIADLRKAVDALHGAGIGVILDVVFNHTGESDEHGAALSLRGLDNAVYYRHEADDPAKLVNDTGCGNTLACDREPVIALVMDSLRHFVRNAGVDGFRFDLATVLGRTPDGFDPAAPLLRAIETEPELADKILIAEPWDVGAGGYRAGAFSARWREWNDRYRDDVRRFWRGDADAAGALATRLAGSQDIFKASGRTLSASINFLAAHDGFSLGDLVSYEQRHNHANGEDNRDGHGDNHSWNGGVEGETDDLGIADSRMRDVRALLATLFLSRGVPMLTAGDEFGRTQRGNNNAYAQDNELTWLDWGRADRDLVDYVAGLSALRDQLVNFRADSFLEEGPESSQDLGGEWLTAAGHRFAQGDWSEASFLALVTTDSVERVCVVVNRSAEAITFDPKQTDRCEWQRIFCSCPEAQPAQDAMVMPARSVTLLIARQKI